MFALLVVVFLATAGLAVDMATASLTQQQMQNAVDTASLEGMRNRDFDEYQYLSDQSRRGLARDLVRMVFDDDLQPTDGPDLMHFGAGPGLQVSNGVGPYHASALITSTNATDDPVLQPNYTNERQGDVVSGRYSPTALHSEDHDYVRPDFVPGVGGASTTLPQQMLAFLVRMRRTTGSNSLDSTADVSSHAPTLPFLLGRGGLLQAGGDQPWDAIGDGITIRATAIAVARPALRVGPPPRDSNGAVLPDHSDSHRPIYGLYPVAIDGAQWLRWFTQFHTPYTLNVEADGRHIEFIELPSGIHHRVGSFVDIHGSTPGSDPTCVGKTVLPAPSTMITASDIGARGYIALYANITGNADPVVVSYIFGSIHWVPGDTTMTFNSGMGGAWGDVHCWVAADNASAHLDSSTPNLTGAQWGEVMGLNQAFVYGDAHYPQYANPANPGGGVTYDFNRIRPGSLLAPALAR